MKFFLSLLLVLVACTPDNTVSVDDAHNQIYFSVQFKKKQCNPSSEPLTPLVIVEPPLKRHLDLCTIAITENQECPFNNYPLACMMVYIHKDTPIPWYISFKDTLSKQIQ